MVAMTDGKYLACTFCGATRVSFGDETDVWCEKCNDILGEHAPDGYKAEKHLQIIRSQEPLASARLYGMAMLQILADSRIFEAAKELMMRKDYHWVWDFNAPNEVIGLVRRGTEKAAIVVYFDDADFDWDLDVIGA